MVSVAKKKQGFEDGSIPDLDTLLSGEPPEPEPDNIGADMTDEELLSDIPPPGEGPPLPTPDRPRTGRKVRVAARAKGKEGEKEKEKGKKAPPKKKGKVATFLGPRITKLRSYLRLTVPQDPIERMRFKLRWLGIIKFPTSFIIIAVLAIMTMLYLWYLIYDYAENTMVYSREVPLLVFFVPLGIAMFSAIYFSFNLLVLNRFERRMTERLEGMLDGSIPLERPKKKKKEKKKATEEKGNEPSTTA